MAIITDPGLCFLNGRGILSNIPSVQRSHISRVRDFRTSRATRKALHKQRVAEQNVPGYAVQELKKNPRQHGSPRAFKVLVAGAEVISSFRTNHVSAYKDEGNSIYFAAFGVAGKAVKLNNTWIEPGNITVNSEGNIYTLFITDEAGDRLSLFLDFTLIERPTGHISFPSGQYAVALQPYAVKFNVKVSANAGAYKSSGKRTLAWNENSAQWKAAAWEDTMAFAYDTVSTMPLFDAKTGVNEASFRDKLAGTSFELTADMFPKKYTCFMYGDTAVPTMHVNVNDPATVPSPPAVRSGSAVKSVFPAEVMFKFTPLGDAFTGAYMLPTGEVYAVIGTGATASHQPLQGHKTSLIKYLLHSSLRPMPHAVQPHPHRQHGHGQGHGHGHRHGAHGLTLDVNELFSLDPMEKDPSNPTNFTDAVSDAANKDFNDIIAYYMDDDIRKVFVQTAPVVLPDATILSIARDSPDNAAFYKQLQVPFVVSSLSRSTLSEAKHCNGPRAAAQLKHIPAGNAVYMRHMDALYRHRFLLKFPVLQQYLDDQRTTDYTAQMDAISAQLQTLIDQNAQDLIDHGPNPGEATVNRDAAKGRGRGPRCIQFYIPNLYAQSVDGHLSSAVSREIKRLTAVFGMLESSALNTASPGGKSFHEAFEAQLRLFHMAALVPQFVRAGSNSEADMEAFGDVLGAAMAQFALDNKNNADAGITAQAAIANDLAGDALTRNNFLRSLAQSMRMAGSLGTWASVIARFKTLVESKPWFQKIVRGSAYVEYFAQASSAVMMLLPLLQGDWKTLKTPGWIVTLSGLVLTFGVKLLSGTVRIVTFWEDIAGLMPLWKTFYGAEGFLKEIGSAASKLGEGIVGWLGRTSAEVEKMAGGSASTLTRIFGRTAEDFLRTGVGALLAAANLIVTIIDIAKANDPLVIAMDAISIASASIELAGIVAGWVSTASIITNAAVNSILATVSSVFGPVALAFAVIGLIVMIAYTFLAPKPLSPVQSFMNKYAAKAGLKMDHDTEIDYFNYVPPDSTATSLDGISLDGMFDGPTYIQLGPRDPASVGLRPAYTIQTARQTPTYLPDTCWCVSTDWQGLTTIFTTTNDTSNPTVCINAEPGWEGLVTARPPPEKYTKSPSSDTLIPVDPTIYTQQLQQQQFRAKTLTDAKRVDRVIDGQKTSFASSAVFAFISAAGGATDDRHLIPYRKNTTIYLSCNHWVDYQWRLTQQAVGPAPFAYAQPEWVLTSENRDEDDFVQFLGPSSTPLVWAVEPALPDWLEITDGGDIRQVEAAAPVVGTEVVYKVTCSLVVAGRTLAQCAKVVIKVVDANEPELGMLKLTKL
ncbi:hypothetical protein B0T22DRAFT_539910 [Podospora appendiculata]|uniref:Uncharacterized protein n=1 Tax=Podospora appendiculata TaxID=314037 RepID=A0AAE1C8L0_9PEZI|nr:hypothetical protein B0T22DRAFT_539910 [Podospora appendiculata]